MRVCVGGGGGGGEGGGWDGYTVEPLLKDTPTPLY